MTEGTIVKGIAGFYYVKAGDKVYSCKARGAMRNDGITPMVGDRVEIEVLPAGDAVVNSILPRKNEFIRPPVANVDCFIIVTAVKNPDPNPRVIDKFIVMAEKSGTDVIICINKADTAAPEEIGRIKEIFGNAYKVAVLSAKNRTGIDELRREIGRRTCALAGPSGVGKSTILNALIGEASMETGDISEKTGRGRHTTRHAELFELPDGGMIFDTPGFTSFEILEAEEDELQHLYPEFEPYIGKCKYDNCRHLREPGCAVREAVRSGIINPERYRAYAAQLLEIREKEKTRYL